MILTPSRALRSVYIADNKDFILIVAAIFIFCAGFIAGINCRWWV
jgi:hypothetical protein